MEELTILFATREEYLKWNAEHPLDSRVEVSVCGAKLYGIVAQVAMHYGKVKIRIRLEKEKT